MHCYIIYLLGFGGNRTTKAMAKRLFTDPALRSRIIGCVPEQHRDKFSELYIGIRKVLGVMSSGKRVQVEKLDLVCRRMHQICTSELPFNAVLPPTMHELFHHTTLLIKENGGVGLKKFRLIYILNTRKYAIFSFSEENLECCHKCLRRIREHLARNTSPEANYKDILRR